MRLPFFNAHNAFAVRLPLRCGRLWHNMGSHEVFVIIMLGFGRGRPPPAGPSAHRHVVGRLGMRWFAIFGVLIAAAPVFAQNGFSATYDSTRQVTLKGSVTRIEWTNPHGFILVNVQDARGVH